VGTALGIDDNANLVVELASGEIRSLNSGEANLCRIKL
jgi:BirA family biotin operon repressor/biotin-[acetyl-CoA-carboxylase] ligase